MSEELQGMGLAKLLGMFGAERAAGVMEGPAFDELIGRVAELTVMVRRSAVPPGLSEIVHGRREVGR